MPWCSEVWMAERRSAAWTISFWASATALVWQTNRQKHTLTQRRTGPTTVLDPCTLQYMDPHRRRGRTTALRSVHIAVHGSSQKARSYNSAEICAYCRTRILRNYSLNAWCPNSDRIQSIFPSNLYLTWYVKNEMVNISGLWSEIQSTVKKEKKNPNIIQPFTNMGWRESGKKDWSESIFIYP